MRLEWLREGLCPIHGMLLTRREEFGWCERCDGGWAMSGDVVTAIVQRDRLVRLDTGGQGTGDKSDG